VLGFDFLKDVLANDPQAAQHRKRHHVIRYRRCPLPRYGRPDDGLQHGDQGRRARLKSHRRQDLAFAYDTVAACLKGAGGTQRWRGGGRCRPIPARFTHGERSTAASSRRW
jgi:hypothetical protein